MMGQGWERIGEDRPIAPAAAGLPGALQLCLSQTEASPTATRAGRKEVARAGQQAVSVGQSWSRPFLCPSSFHSELWKVTPQPEFDLMPPTPMCKLVYKHGNIHTHSTGQWLRAQAPNLSHGSLLCVPLLSYLLVSAS